MKVDLNETDIKIINFLMQSLSDIIVKELKTYPSGALPEETKSSVTALQQMQSLSKKINKTKTKTS